MNKVICNFFILQKVRHVLLHVFAMSKHRYWKDSRFHFAYTKATVYNRCSVIFFPLHLAKYNDKIYLQRIFP